MKFITKYDKLDVNEKMKIGEYISVVEHDQKSIILQYLKNGMDAGVRCSSVFDYIKKEYRPRTIHLYTDGEFFWNDEDIYHFEKYNLQLNEEFINKVFQNIEKS